MGINRPAFGWGGQGRDISTRAKTIRGGGEFGPSGTSPLAQGEPKRHVAHDDFGQQGRWGSGIWRKSGR